MKASVEDIRSSFIMHSSEGDTSIELIENFEMTAEFKQLVAIPYFKEKFEDLATYSDNPRKGINKYTFFKYTKLPSMIGDRLFAVLDSDHDNYLNKTEFVKNMVQLYSNDFVACLKLVFSLYDFDKNGVISKEDVRLLLSHVPIESSTQAQTQKEGNLTLEGGGMEEYLDRAESQSEIDALLSICFADKERLTFEDFVEAVEHKTSDLFICLYSLLKSNLPTLSSLKRLTAGVKKDPKASGKSTLLQTPDKGHKLAPARVLDKFSPTAQIVKRSRRALSAREELKTVIRSEAYQSPKKSATTTLASQYLAPPSAKKVQSVPEPKALQIQSKLYQISDLYCVCGKPMQDAGKRLCASCMAKRRGARIEGYLIKKTRSKSELGKFWIAIEHQEIYCYREKDAKSYKCVHSLIGCIVKEEPAEKHGKEMLFPFSLHFANGKTKRYYALSKDHLQKWLYSLKKNANTAVLSDYYELKKELGKGRFGSVMLGVHKKTGKKVAVKCMKKTIMSAQELELVRAEVEVLRICQHPNIVRLYDMFESSDFIYLVMELLEGGDMMDYLQKKEFKVPETRAAKIVHSLATALYYLHSYGIIHRDMKPDNILLSSKTEDSDVKIIDFGLSKIIGPTETCTEACGTLFYAAPEVIQKKPYDKSADIWSLGVIAYLLLTGELPFNDIDDQKLINLIVLSEPEYSRLIWRKVSKEGLDFVKRLLVKDPKKRMPLTEVLEHPWLVKDRGDVMELRTQKTNAFVAYTLVQPNSVIKVLRKKSIQAHITFPFLVLILML